MTHKDGLMTHAITRDTEYKDDIGLGNELVLTCPTEVTLQKGRRHDVIHPPTSTPPHATDRVPLGSAMCKRRSSNVVPHLARDHG